MEPEQESPTAFVLQHFLVAYFDVLGQRNELRQLTALPENEDQLSKAHAVLKRTLGVVLGLRDFFKIVFEAYTRPGEYRRSLPEAEQLALAPLRQSEVQFYGFSDSFIVSVPLRTHDEHCTQMNGVYAALVAASIMPLNALGLGHAIRGGIDVGLGVQLGGGEVYGAALERAYTLEHDVSDYPRITVGEELISYLEFVRDQPPSSVAAKCAKGVAERCLRFFARDSDGKMILDYLGQAVREIGTTAIRPEILRMVCDFAASEHERFERAGQPTLVSRYKRLNDYLASRKALWEL